MSTSNYSYKFQFIGEDGLYNLQVSDDTLMYRLIFPNSKYVTGSSIAILNARDSNVLNEYEDGLIVNWIHEILSSFDYKISAK
ncbi:MAG: hypothetical protein RIS20_2288 [Bacteroidota bacterium]|jgi:hypothetical protein